MKETKVIHITDDSISDSFAYLVSGVDVVCTDIVTMDKDECTIAIITDNAVILADISDKKVQRFQVVKDSNMPKVNALITLTAMSSDDKYNDVSVEWGELTDDYNLVFSRGE